VVTAARPGGERAEIEAPWLAGRRIASLRVSHDGARVLVVSTGADAVAQVDLAGVQRLADGRPVSLTRAFDTSVLPSLMEVREAVWTGESGIAVLGRRAVESEAFVHLSRPPGMIETLESPVPAEAETIDVAASPGDDSVLVGTADGHLWQRAGARWVEVPLEQPVRDPAFAG
jgi:hypothetical protein